MATSVVSTMLLIETLAIAAMFPYELLKGRRSWLKIVGFSILITGWSRPAFWLRAVEWPIYVQLMLGIACWAVGAAIIVSLRTKPKSGGHKSASTR